VKTVGSSNCCVFEMKHATGNGNLNKDLLFVFFLPRVNKNS